MKRMNVTQKTIGEYTFYISPFAAFTAANMTGELGRLIGPILGALIPLASGSDKSISSITADSVMQMQLDDALPAFTQAFSSLSGDQFERLMRKLLVDYQNISVEGPATEGATKRMDYDLANEVFCTALDDMFLLCWEVIKINYSSFFRRIGARSGSPADTETVAPTSANTESST